MRIALEMHNKTATALPQKRFFVLATKYAFKILNPKPAIPYPRIEISLIFISTAEIRRLNLTWRKKDKSTDVLSFPYHAGSVMRNVESGNTVTLGKIMPVKDSDGVIRLGEILIVPQIAKKEAAQFEHSVPEHLIFLFVHGLLHLLGYDHERSRSDSLVMQKIQNAVLRQFSYHN